MRRVATVGAALALLLAILPRPAALAAGGGDVAVLVNTINTSAWSPASPDPSGLAYRSSDGKLIVSDSEVDEIPALWTGNNIFVSSTSGTLSDYGTTAMPDAKSTATPPAPFSVEPVDIALDNQAAFFVDDDKDKVFRLTPGTDGKLFTADDKQSTTLTISSFNGNDGEGLAYNTADRSLFISDGVTHTLYHVDRGPDGQFGPVKDASGVSHNDDVITSFDTAAVGMRDPQGVEYDPATGHLFLTSRSDPDIAEVTTTGALVNLYDISSAGLLDEAGITLAPGSDNPAQTHIYVSDRGLDNDPHPDENDGRIFEFKIAPMTGNQPPVLTNPGNQFNVEGDVVSLQLAASDPENGTITYGATGLPAGLAVDTSTGLISGTVAAGASTASPYQITVTASDGTNQVQQQFSWDISLSNHKPIVSSVPDETNVEGDTVSLQVDATDADNEPLTYTATNLPPGLSIDATTGLISGTIQSGAASGSQYTSSVTATDGAGASDTASFRWTVTAVAASQPPVVTNPGNQTSTEGDAVNLQVQATDPESDPLTYGAIGLPPGVTINVDSGLISGTVSAGASSGSPYSVTVSASDGSSTDAESFTWTIKDLTAPAAPTGLTVTGDAGGIRLDWADNTEADLAGYNVYRRTGTVPFAQLNTSPISASQYYDTTATPNVKSIYKVTAVDSGGNESLGTTGNATRSKIVFRSASGAKTPGATTLAVPKPGSVSSGDVMLAAIDVRSGATISPPSGWTLVRNTVSGSALRQAVYRRVAGSAEPASYTFKFSASSVATGQIAAYGGVSTSSPVDTSASKITTASTSTITAPSVSASTARSVLVAVFAIDASTDISPPASMVGRDQQRAASTTNAKKVSSEVADDVLDATGSSGTRVATAGQPQLNIATSVVLRPA